MARPREWDRDQVADDLVAWAQLDDSINLCAFCANKLIPPSKLPQWSVECEIFRQAYDLAKIFIAVRREAKLNKNELHVKAYDLNAATYDYFMKKEKRDQAKFECDLDKEKTEHQHQMRQKYGNETVDNPIQGIHDMIMEKNSVKESKKEQ